MHKKDLIKGLKSKLFKIGGSVNGHNNHRWVKGQRAFANFLVHYLEKLKITHDEKYDFWDIEPHLPQLMVDAFEELRTGIDTATVGFRKEYEVETGHDVPNITDLGASDVLDRASAVQTTLGFMLREITGQDWVESKIDTYCNAQSYVLQQAFDKFLRLVYRRGLCEVAEKCGVRGMSGRFSETDLRTYIMAGRIMFTFARRIDKSKDSYYKKGKDLFCNEWSVSFVGEDGDSLCLSAGIASVGCDFLIALKMIEDVITHWPVNQDKQIKLFKADTKVSMG